MKFLLNMNLPRQLGRLLATGGHTWRHVGDLGLHAADDPAIVQEAKAQDEIVLTHDLDYGTLLAFSGDTCPSVVIFRLSNLQPQRVFERMTERWLDWGPALEEGAILVLEDGASRIRRLPIGRS
jgi:predicted nuclease of predicted toxin-antitoxin system